MTERRISGRCQCGEIIIKVEHSRWPTCRTDGSRFIYAKNIDDGSDIFRCEGCGQVITTTFVALYPPEPPPERPAGDRRRLPDRRPSIRDVVEWLDSTGNKRKAEVSFGFDVDGSIREVFCLAAQEITDMQAVVHDACIAVSHALQMGARIADLAKSFGEFRNEGEAEGRSASVIGALAHAGAAMEKQLWGPK